ncbi:MAG: carbon-nitrogen hydrolase [Candidatus Binatia bacterium]|nr:carbon-nitrogen hydrolase [Candidatus Binatia bacterium]
MKRTLIVGIAQFNPRLGDVEANFSLCERYVQQARAQGVELLVFPELSLTGYHLRDMVATVALRTDAPEMMRLKALSREVPFVLGLVEESPDYRFYNAAVYLAGGEICHLHRKVYLPTYGMFDEQRYFARGDRVRAFETPFGRASILICEDLWHPSTAYLAALDRALLIICPSASPLRGISDGAVQDDNARYWELINRMYAETFSLFLVYANRVGFEDGVGFWGGSEILDPFGRCLAKGRYYEEDFLTAELCLDVVRRKRLASPLLRDEDVSLTIRELMRIRDDNR